MTSDGCSKDNFFRCHFLQKTEDSHARQWAIGVKSSYNAQPNCILIFFTLPHTIQYPREQCDSIDLYSFYWHSHLLLSLWRDQPFPLIQTHALTSKRTTMTYRKEVAEAFDRTWGFYLLWDLTKSLTRATKTYYYICIWQLFILTSATTGWWELMSCEHVNYNTEKCHRYRFIFNAWAFHKQS